MAGVTHRPGLPGCGLKTDDTPARVRTPMHLGFYGNFLIPLLNGQPLRPMFGGRVTSTENQVLVAARERTQALFGTSSYLVAWLDTACKMMADGRIDGCRICSS